MDHGLHQFCRHYCCCHCYHQTPISVCVFGSVVVGLVWSLEHTSIVLILTRVFWFWFSALPTTKLVMVEGWCCGSYHIGRVLATIADNRADNRSRSIPYSMGPASTRVCQTLKSPMDWFITNLIIKELVVVFAFLI
jgi:hypothetical protein